MKSKVPLSENTKNDKRIDAYIARSEDFAKPILIHLRELVHKMCPEVEETMKWSFPHFAYKGGPLCHMAAFKQHCAFGFWKASLMNNGAKLVDKAKTEEAMGHMGKIKSVKDLPSNKELKAYIKEAMRLNDEGVKLAVKKDTAKKELKAHPDFVKALSKNKKAQKVYEAFSYSHKKEYVEWISEAKRDETRSKRIEQSLDWLSEGKDRNWKYK